MTFIGFMNPNVIVIDGIELVNQHVYYWQSKKYYAVRNCVFTNADLELRHRNMARYFGFHF